MALADPKFDFCSDNFDLFILFISLKLVGKNFLIRLMNSLRMRLDASKIAARRIELQTLVQNMANFDTMLIILWLKS